ncbi:hypothetical protein RJT34_11530 [Clitoria ternatea]|uniref:Uncharacterized protein n=1 Tax=Clitoria ternatea TaxID=43366 RepID=A0AAN9JMP4_CLITE
MFSSSDSPVPTLQNDTLHAVVKKEHEEDCDSTNELSLGQESLSMSRGSGNYRQEKVSPLRGREVQVTCPTIQTDASGVDKNSADVMIYRCPTFSDNGRKTSPQLAFHIPNVKEEIHEDIVDDLDHMILKERLRMLLVRRLPGLTNTASEDSNGGLSETMKQTVKIEEISSADGTTAVARDQCYDTPAGSHTSLLESPPGVTSGSLLNDYTSSKSTVSVISAGLHEDDHILKSKGIIMQSDSNVEQNVMTINNDGPNNSTTSKTFAKVKDEPWHYSENHNNVNKDGMGSISAELPNVKVEGEVYNEYHDDPLEHMSLIDRLNFLMNGEDSSLNISTSYRSMKKTFPSSASTSTFSESAEHLGTNHRRKRKRTATESVQTALEEDAPGLLQVLLDKGVLVDEIKLYGEKEDDEALDESFCEDSFSELEAVVTKIFSHRHSFFKFPITRGTRASRANYCFACLFSLVEQTRYLKFRKWPVEWGWCRDLQSFIFVFERHNRIVLERPEYGYATYFFELVDSLPVEWQIKRLVIVMKLTTCSRISLIENKELLVGEDLSEGEAKVLMEYGWAPNTGLGTMLNYCDRVVHDRKNEKDSSEWRSKIGKMLMDGYNGGTIVTPDIPKNLSDYMCPQGPDMNSYSPISD